MPVVPSRGALGCHLQYTGCGELMRFAIQYIIKKNTFSNCHQTLKQISVGSLLGATNYISFLYGAASLKRLGSTGLC